MGEIFLQQACDLALEVSRGVDRIDSSLDEALLEARALRHEIRETRQLLLELSQHSLRASLA